MQKNLEILLVCLNLRTLSQASTSRLTNTCAAGVNGTDGRKGRRGRPGRQGAPGQKGDKGDTGAKVSLKQLLPNDTGLLTVYLVPCHHLL